MRPSLDTKPITIRKPSEALSTEMPLVCTTLGSCEVTSCSLFCTCICAMSGSAVLVKVSVIVDWPVEVEVADM